MHDGQSEEVDDSSEATVETRRDDDSHADCGSVFG